MIGVRFPAEAMKRFFSLLHRCVKTGSGTHSISYSVGPVTVSPGIKGRGREADHSPPSSIAVKKAWSCTSTPPYVFMSWCLVMYRCQKAANLNAFTFRCFGMVYGDI
jgi:hypothetical protein